MIVHVQLNDKTLTTEEQFEFVGYNDDYYIEVAGDVPAAAVAWMICGGKAEQKLLDENHRVKVDGSLLTSERMIFGLTWDGYASRPLIIHIAESILSVAADMGSEGFEPPPQSIIDDIIATINRIEQGYSLTPEDKAEIAALVIDELPTAEGVSYP